MRLNEDTQGLTTDPPMPKFSPALVLLAGSQGMFPMTVDGGAVHWFIPDPRAIIPLETGLHVSRSLAKCIRQERFEIRFDTCYESVMRHCLRSDHNWISEEFIQVYTRLFDLGWGHCVEAWQDGRLVGGAYGFAMGGYFSAESMFHLETNASKVALWALTEKCRELGFSLFDVQYLTDHLASLGAQEVPHATYLTRLEKALKATTPWSPRRDQWPSFLLES